jgi:sialate O-acetylesterase
MVQDKFGYLRGFEVASEDRKFYFAQAEISGNQVVVRHPQGQTIMAVRYAWADAPVDANLFNRDGLPAAPFRTDQWPGLTIKQKFD